MQDDFDRCVLEIDRKLTLIMDDRTFPWVRCATDLKNEWWKCFVFRLKIESRLSSQVAVI